MSKIVARKSASCKISSSNDPKLDLFSKTLLHQSIKATKICDVIADPALGKLFVKREKNTQNQKSMKEKRVDKSNKKSINKSDKKTNHNKAQLRAGILGNQEIFPPPQAFEELLGLDLSHLTPEERAAILQVAARAKEVEQVESQKLEKIQQQVQSFTPHCQEISNGAQPISMVDGRDDEKIKTQYDAPTQTEKTASKTADAKKIDKNKPQSSASVISKKFATKDPPTKYSSDNTTKTTTNKNDILTCYMCFQPLRSNTKTNNGTKLSSAEAGDPNNDNIVVNDLPKCSVCLQPTCDACSAATVLAKKGDRLCRCCLKQREFAARSNVWMNNKRYLYRSASDQIPQEVLNVLQSEEASAQNALRSHSFSDTSSKPNSPQHQLRSREDSMKQKGGSNFSVMSVSEQLIRRNSSNDEAITSAKQNSDVKSASVKKNCGDVCEQKREKQQNSGNENKAQKCTTEKSTSSTLKDVAKEKTVGEKNDQLTKVTVKKQQSKQTKIVQSPPKIETKSKGKTEKNVLKNNENERDAPQALNNTTAEEIIAVKESSKEDITQKNTGLSAVSSSGSVLVNAKVKSSSALASSLPFIQELKQLFENEKSPLQEQIKRNAIDLTESSADFISEKFDNDNDLKFKQVQVKDKIDSSGNKSINRKIKTDDSVHKVVNVETIMASTEKPTISEKEKVFTPQPIKISQEKPKEQPSKIILSLQSVATIESKETIPNVKISTSSSSMVKENKSSRSKTEKSDILGKEMKTNSSSTIQKSSTPNRNDKAKQDQIFSSNEAEQHVDCLENSPTAREDDKTSCSRATSVVSSLAESEGPAEWSVDEMDDGDTLFLVTSSENKMHNVQPGITTPNNLRSVTSEERVDMTATSRAAFSTSDLIQNSFEFICEENDTEGDFSHLVPEEVKENIEYSSVGSLKRTSLFHNLSFESKKDSSTEESSNKKAMSRKEEKFEAMPGGKSSLNEYMMGLQQNEQEKSTSPSTQSDNLLVIPGQSLFKRTKCEIDEDVDFYDDQMKQSFTKSFRTEKNLNSFHPVPAKRSQKLHSTTKYSNVPFASDNPQNTTKINDSAQFHLKPKLPSDNNALSKNLPSNAFEADMAKRNQFSNKSGTKILQTPSGARLPISPLAKNNVSSQRSGDSRSSTPSSVRNSGTILAVCGKSYYDSDSESESTDSEGEHDFLLAATTSQPVHPEEMKSPSQEATAARSRDKNSFFFRRTTSTDNFETLLQNNTETPRSPRRTLTNSTRAKSPNLMNLYQENKLESSWSRSSPLPTYASNKATTDQPKLEKNKLGSNNFSGNPSYYSSTEYTSSNINSPERYASFDSFKSLPSKKETTVVLSPAAVKDSTNESDFHSVNTFTRCVSCGVLAQTSDNITPSTTVSSTPVVKEEPTGKLNNKEPPGATSVNSSTQVTPDKENPPFNIASIDLCQLTALIQALRNADELPTDKKQKQPLENTSNFNSALQALTNTTSTQPVTIEPQSKSASVSSQLNTRDAATDTCIESYSAIAPRDRVMTCQKYSHDKSNQFYENESSRLDFYGRKTDAGVGTHDSNSFFAHQIPPLQNKLFAPAFADAGRSFYRQHDRKYPYRYMNAMIHPYDDYSQNYFTMPDFYHRHVDRQITPPRDYYLQRRTTIGEIEMHSNIYNDLPQVNESQSPESFYSSPSGFDFNNQRISVYPTRMSQYRRDPRYNSSFYPTSYNPMHTATSPSPQMIKHKETGPKINPTNPENVGFVFPNHQAKDEWKPNHIPQKRMDPYQPYSDPDNFKFLRRDDLETRRSASVPVTTHSSAPPTNYAYGGKQQSFRTDPATQFRTIGQHKNNKEDFKMANNIGGRGDRNFAADAIDHENSYFSESVSTRNLDTHTSVIFSQNKSSASFMPVASSHLQHGEFGNSSNPNRYTEDIDAAPPQTMLFSNSKRSDYDKRSQYEPKHDNYVQTRYNPLSFGDRRLTARDRNELVQEDSPIFRQTLEDLDQEEKELDMKLRYLELGRGRTSASSSGKFYSSATLNMSPDRSGDQNRVSSSAKRTTSLDTFNKQDPNKVEYKNDVLDSRAATAPHSPSDQKRNYVVVNNVDQIFEEERRRRRRGEDATFKQDTLKTCRSSSADRAHYLQAPYQKPTVSNSAAPLSGPVHDQHTYRNWQHYKPPNMDALTTSHRNPKIYSHDSIQKPSESKIRMEERGSKTCGQSHRSQAATMQGHYSNCSHASSSPRTHYSQNRRNPSTDHKACSPHHSSRRCYQVNYVMQNYEDVTSPWRKIAKQQESLAPELFEDECYNRAFCDSNLNLKIGNRSSYSYAKNSQHLSTDVAKQTRHAKQFIDTSVLNTDKKTCPVITLTDATPPTQKDEFENEYRTTAAEGNSKQNWDEESFESSYQGDDSRNAVSDTEEYNLRKEKNIDWFDKPLKSNQTKKRKKESSTYAEFCNDQTDLKQI